MAQHSVHMNFTIEAKEILSVINPSQKEAILKVRILSRLINKQVTHAYWIILFVNIKYFIKSCFYTNLHCYLKVSSHEYAWAFDCIHVYNYYCYKQFYIKPLFWVCQLALYSWIPYSLASGKFSGPNIFVDISWFFFYLQIV